MDKGRGQAMLVAITVRGIVGVGDNFAGGINF
jgi:hypothetical protein